MYKTRNLGAVRRVTCRVSPRGLLHALLAAILIQKHSMFQNKHEKHRLTRNQSCSQKQQRSARGATCPLSCSPSLSDDATRAGTARRRPRSHIRHVRFGVCNVRLPASCLQTLALLMSFEEQRERDKTARGLEARACRPVRPGLRPHSLAVPADLPPAREAEGPGAKFNAAPRP